ncbi:MAG: solute carrier organic anion transporter [Mesorhizobium sp.]|nr:MAG: solute carrier organic anion transporter [Mesorhizobium sp.]
MAWEISDISIGDEVTVTVTIIKLVDDDQRASVSIPFYGFPHSIPAPKKAKPGQKVDVTGEVSRVDLEDRLVTIKGMPGGTITVDVAAVTGWAASPYREGLGLRDSAD